jgi:hypothetical protein
VEPAVKQERQVTGSRRPATTSSCRVSKPQSLVAVEIDAAPADVEGDR